MSAIKHVVVLCDGVNGRGCVFGSRMVLNTDYPTIARKELAEQGWRYTRILNNTHNATKHIDVCRLCLM